MAVSQKKTAATRERAWRNQARLKSCTIHEFDWRGAIKAERARRLARQEETGVIVNVRLPYICRCKNCGGKVLVEYAGAYMDGVKAALKQKENQKPDGGAKNGD